MVLFLVSFGLSRIETDNPERNCQQEENALYSERWADRCEELGKEYAMCQLPKEHTDEIGFHDHVKRSEACRGL